MIKNEKFNKNLTKLPSPINEGQDVMYNQCLDFLQESITSIALFDDESNNRNIYQDLIQNLDRFPKLKSALIHTAITDMRYQNVVKYITPVIEDNLVPSLKELCITSSANDSYCFQLSTQGQASLLPMMKLKSLKIYTYSEKCVTISEDLTLFIMNQCSNLNHLCINITGKIFSCLSTFSYQ